MSYAQLHPQTTPTPLHTQILEDLSVAARWLAHERLHEGVNNHISGRSEASSFFVNLYGFQFSELREKNFAKIPLAPLLSQDPFKEYCIEPSAYYLHAQLFQDFPKVNCIIHTHMPYATAVSCLQNPYLPMIHQNNIRFDEEISYDLNYQGLAKHDQEALRVSTLMRNKSVLMMGNHGVLIMGRSVAEALHMTYYLERACQNYILALSTGQSLREISPEIVKKTAPIIKNDLDYAHQLLESARRILT